MKENKLNIILIIIVLAVGGYTYFNSPKQATIENIQTEVEEFRSETQSNFDFQNENIELLKSQSKEILEDVNRVDENVMIIKTYSEETSKNVNVLLQHSNLTLEALSQISNQIRNINIKESNKHD